MASSVLAAASSWAACSTLLVLTPCPGRQLLQPFVVLLGKIERRLRLGYAELRDLELIGARCGLEGGERCFGLV